MLIVVCGGGGCGDDVFCQTVLFVEHSVSWYLQLAVHLSKKASH